MEEIQEMEKDEVVTSTVIKEKKPRSEKQLEAMTKMQEGRKQKQKIQLEEREKRQNEEKEELERLRKIVEEKIVKKAVNIKKKHHTKKEIISILDEDTSTDNDDVLEKPRQKPKPKTKQEPVLPIEKPEPKPPILFPPKATIQPQPPVFVFRNSRIPSFTLADLLAKK